MKPTKKHAIKKHQHLSQDGYISTDVKKIMGKNEKVIMGVLVGGIVVFLILSVVLLFGRGKQQLPTSIFPTKSPEERVNTTPYPTIPPIKDMTVMVNERRLNPPDVSIKAGNYVSFFNIGDSTITIEGVDANSAFLNFSVATSDVREVKFSNPGKYTYRVKGNPKLVGTITIE